MIIALLISLLFAVSVGGLAYVIVRAALSGAEAYSGAYSETAARQLEDVFLFIPPRRIAEIAWAVSAIAFLAVFLAFCNWSSPKSIVISLLLGLVAGIASMQLPDQFIKLLKLRRLRRFNLQLVDTLISMSNALKAGFSILQAFESVVRDGENPIAQEFDVFLQQTRVGVSFSEALRNLDRRVGSDDLTLVVLSIECARQTGGNLTEILEKIASTIRERMRIENRIRTLTAQGRLQGIIVGAMPLVIGVALTIVEPDMMRLFVHSTLGVGIMVAVAVLIAMGGLVIRKIVAIDV